MVVCSGDGSLVWEFLSWIRFLVVYLRAVLNSSSSVYEFQIQVAFIVVDLVVADSFSVSCSVPCHRSLLVWKL